MSRGSLVFLVAAACGNHPVVTGDARDSRDARLDAVVDTIGDTTMPDTAPACATPGVVPAMHAELVASGLTQPVFVAQPPGSTDLYVVEKTGRVVIVRDHAVVATFLDASAQVNIPAGGEGGLLSIAFADDYVTSGRVFAFMTVAGDQQVAREYRRIAPELASSTPVQDLVSVPNGGYNNIGGTLAIGPDHALWLGTGDAGDAPEAADPSSRRGKMLRIDIDQPGTPPPGNLAGYVWDYGLRNPFRWSFDRATGEVYIADAGEAKREEVDIEPANSGHRDYGWPRMEGDGCRDAVASCAPAGTLPAYARPHQADFSVIIGGVVYRGAALPCLRGRYLFAIFGGTGHVLSWVWDGTAVTSEMDLTDRFDIDTNSIVAFGEDRDGEVYLVTLAGAVYKIVPT